MLMPKRTKYRKPHRLSYEGRSNQGREVTFGEFGLVAESGAYISNRQIEAARVAMTRHMRRGGKVWIKIFPDKPITAKPAETRMGSGKGAPDDWVAVVKPGRILFELAGIPERTAREAFRLATHKLPIKTRFVIGDVELTEEELAKFSEVQAEVVEQLEEEAEMAAEAAEESADVEEVEAEDVEAEEATSDDGAEEVSE